MVKVKICGNTNQEDVKKAIDLGADFIGFIFAPSKRSVTPRKAADIMKAFDQYAGFVGVFVNEPVTFIQETAKELNLKWVQLHGDETAADCIALKKMGLSVIKAFHVKTKQDLTVLNDYPAAYHLLDAFHENLRGGTGISFDWHILKHYPNASETIFLAGGLTPDNVQDAVRKVRPFAVDVASGVERVPGVKDHNQLMRFFKNARDI